MPSEKLLQLLEHTITGGKACDMMCLSLMCRLLQGLQSFGTFLLAPPGMERPWNSAVVIFRNVHQV
jgi:hypothetical protein